MRIAVLTNDTRGGVQPYAALAMGLRAAGHQVRAVAPAELTFLFGDRGIPVLPLDRTQDAMAIVAGGVGWKDSVATVTAPPNTVVSMPPLIVLRVAQPEAKTSKPRAARS